MLRKIYKIEAECDVCHKKVIFERVGKYGNKLPERWGYHEVTGCGLTDYTRVDELCPDCLINYE